MLRAFIDKLKSTFGNNPRSSSSIINLEEYNVVSEGSAQILFLENENVFYNPIQQFNRDLSVTCIKAWDNLYGTPRFLKGSHTERKRSITNSEFEPSTKKRKVQEDHEDINRIKSKAYIHILEAFSATGLRAIRYAHEIPNIKQIIANDLLEYAVKSIQRNVDHNKLSHIVKANKDDANVLMYRYKAENKKFHVIDIDPYGTATSFIDSSMQCIEDGGLMLVTCTDLSVLAGSGYPEKCFALYGGLNMARHEATHESALRLVLNLLGQKAASYKKSIEPVLSLSIDFYVRVFVCVRTSPSEVKNLQHNTMMVYVCSGCGSYHTQRLGKQTQRESKKGKPFTKYSIAKGPPVDRLCGFCNSVHHVVGPMYAGPLHNAEFIDEVLHINRSVHSNDTYKTKRRIEGMLTLAKHELHAPFYFSPNSLSSILKFQVPPIKTIVAGLGSLGYQSSLTHANPSAIKTDAPWEAIWYVMKRYCLDNKLCEPSKLNQNSVGYKMLQNNSIGNTHSEWETKLSYESNEQSSQVESLRKLKILRYQENPTKFWGPKAKPNSLNK